MAKVRNFTLKKRKRLITLLSLLAILGLATASYAWFVVSTFAGVTDLDIYISLGEELRASMQDNGSDIDKYQKEITPEMINEYLATQGTSLEDTVLAPVTSSDGIVFTNQDGVVREANRRSYLEFECYFIATKDMWVHLTTEDTSVETDGSGGTIISSADEMPKAEVVSCTRVGFESGDSIAVYEPNKAGQETPLATFDLPSGTMTYSDDNTLFHLNELEPTLVTIRIWIDGEDTQCDDDVQDADLSIQLGFIGCDENNNPIA